MRRQPARRRRTPFCADITSRCGRRPAWCRRTPCCAGTTNRCSGRPEQARRRLALRSRRRPRLRPRSPPPPVRRLPRSLQPVDRRPRPDQPHPRRPEAVGSWAGSRGCSAAESMSGTSRPGRRIVRESPAAGGRGETGQTDAGAQAASPNARGRSARDRPETARCRRSSASPNPPRADRRRCNRRSVTIAPMRFEGPARWQETEGFP